MFGLKIVKSHFIVEHVWVSLFLVTFILYRNLWWEIGIRKTRAWNICSYLKISWYWRLLISIKFPSRKDRVGRHEVWNIVICRFRNKWISIGKKIETMEVDTPQTPTPPPPHPPPPNLLGTEEYTNNKQ